MTVRIIPATLRDLSYIAANLRPEDRAEIDCQLDHWSPALLALTALQGFAYVAELGGNPEAGFGAAEQRGGLWIAWELGHAPHEALRARDYGVLSRRAWAAGRCSRRLAGRGAGAGCQ